MTIGTCPTLQQNWNSHITGTSNAFKHPQKMSFSFQSITFAFGRYPSGGLLFLDWEIKCYHFIWNNGGERIIVWFWNFGSEIRVWHMYGCRFFIANWLEFGTCMVYFGTWTFHCMRMVVCIHERLVQFVNAYVSLVTLIGQLFFFLFIYLFIPNLFLLMKLRWNLLFTMKRHLLVTVTTLK